MFQSSKQPNCQLYPLGEISTITKPVLLCHNMPKRIAKRLIVHTFECPLEVPQQIQPIRYRWEIRKALLISLRQGIKKYLIKFSAKSLRLINITIILLSYI